MDKIESWMEGYKKGEEVVFQFLTEMTFIDIAKLKKHYKEWSNADAYKTLVGEKKGFKSMLKD